jgi:hypothetical protein
MKADVNIGQMLFFSVFSKPDLWSVDHDRQKEIIPSGIIDKDISM